MKFSVAAVLAASAAVSNAVPLFKRAGNGTLTDTDILNFALTLEHLENNFYSNAMKNFSQDAFVKAGLPAFARGRFQQIGEQEATHVKFLSGALGSAATQPCTYKFPYTDPSSFAALSSVIEGVGVSAYLGAAAAISNKAYLTAAAAILTDEARHTAWSTSAVLKAQPWSTAFDTPLTPNQIYTIASAFIVSCPSSNPALPVQAFPALTASTANAGGGSQVTYSFSNNGTGPFYALYYQGLNKFNATLDSSKKATVPAGLKGTFYTVISTNISDATASSTVAGPLISVVNFDSSASVTN